MATEEEPPRQFELLAEHELRFEIPPDCTRATLTLKSGSAEIFGVEMALNKAYPLAAGYNAAAFTWFGARLALVAPDSALAYTSTDTPMPMYVNAHAILQSRRDAARVSALAGPRVVILGPPDSGKTALARVLTAYCVKANASVLLVDLDPAASGAIGVIPGALAIAQVKHCDIEEGGPMCENSAVIMYGHTSSRGNLPVVEKVLSGAGAVLDKMMALPDYAPHTGCIVDTCGDVDVAGGLDLALACVNAVRASVVLVVDAERLFASVRARLAKEAPETEVVLLQKSGGVVSRDAGVRQRERSRRVKDYFYGLDGRLNPFSTVVDFASVTVLQIVGETVVVPDCVLPSGATSTLDPMKPTTVTLSRDLLHNVLGMSQAQTEEEVLTAPVFGFVHVTKVDTERNSLTVLAPSPGRLPGKFLLCGSIKWME